MNLKFAKTILVIIIITLVLSACNNENNKEEQSGQNDTTVENAPANDVSKSIETAETITDETSSDTTISGTETSNEMNEEKSLQISELLLLGEQQFNEKKYYDALLTYIEILDIDNTNDEAHYNCALSMLNLYEEDDAIWTGSIPRIVEHLDAAISLNEKYREYLDDVRFDSIRDSFHFYTLQGLNIDKTEDVLFLLEELDWYFPSSVAMEPIIGGLSFNESGICNISYNLASLDVDYSIKCRYEVDGRMIKFILDDPMIRKRTFDDILNNDDIYEEQNELKGEMTEEGTITIDTFEYYATSYFPVGDI